MDLDNQTKRVLLEAKNMEKMAEENCEKLLEQLKVNGFHRDIEKIKNDEKNHQKIVDQLIGLLKEN